MQSNLQIETQEDVDVRGNASISNYRIVKTIGKGHYSK